MSTLESTYSPPQTQKGSSQHWKWLVPFGFLIFIGLAAVVAFIVAIFFIVFNSMKSSWAYEEGVRLASTHPAVVASLGEPVTTGWFMTGRIETSRESGSANLAIPLRGPNERGTLYVVAERSEGEWSMAQAVVQLDDHDDAIDLLAKDERETGAKRLEADDPS